MIDTKPLDDTVSVSSFVPPASLGELAGRFRTVINNRPDGEEPGQATSAELAEAASSLGLDYVSIPIVPGQITDTQIAAFTAALETHPGPVLAFCKSGMRAASMWALASAGSRGSEAALAAAARAGYDLSPLKSRIEARTRT